MSDAEKIAAIRTYLDTEYPSESEYEKKYNPQCADDYHAWQLAETIREMTR